MRFVFSEVKATQTAGLILELQGPRMSYMKLIKLMYLADRKSLIETGYPITGDRLVSMDRGPVLSRVLNLITDDCFSPDSQWRRYISEPSSYEIELNEVPPTDELSEYEIAVIGDIVDQFGHMDRWMLVEYTHELPEWTDPEGSSLQIDERVILRAAGKSDEEIEDIFAQAEAAWTFRTLSSQAS